jgi:hypothetical protein
MDKALINVMFENFKEVYNSEIKGIEKKMLNPNSDKRILELNRNALLQELRAMESTQRHFNLMMI